MFLPKNLMIVLDQTQTNEAAHHWEAACDGMSNNYGIERHICTIRITIPILRSDSWYLLRYFSLLQNKKGSMHSRPAFYNCSIDAQCAVWSMIFPPDNRKSNGPRQVSSFLPFSDSLTIGQLIEEHLSNCLSLFWNETFKMKQAYHDVSPVGQSLDSLPVSTTNHT